MQNSPSVRSRQAVARHHRPYFGGVALTGERLPCKQDAVGSNPIVSTKYTHGAADASPARQACSWSAGVCSNHIPVGTYLLCVARMVEQADESRCGFNSRHGGPYQGVWPNGYGTGLENRHGLETHWGFESLGVRHG